MSLHVALVSPAYLPAHGGLAVLAQELSEGLAAEGCHVSLLVPEGSEAEFSDRISVYPFSIYPRKPGLESIATQTMQSLAVSKILGNINHRNPLSLIEFSNWKSLGILAGHGLRIPRVSRLSTGALDIGPSLQVENQHWGHLGRMATLGLNHLLEMAAVRSSHFLITHTKASWSHAKKIYRLGNKWRKRHCIIPPGLPKPQKQGTTTTNKQGFVVLFIGKTNHRKGIDRVVGLAEQLANYPQHSIQLRIIGRDSTPPNWPYLQASMTPEARALVTYLGPSSSCVKARELQTCDLVIVPSRHESFGLVAVEGMLYGKSVIACETPGLSEIVVDGESGFLIAQDAPVNQLTKKVLTLADDPYLATRLGEYGRKRAEEHFTRSIFARRTLRCYRKIIALYS